jgi:uncharacterized protein (TIGR02145 family)
MSKHVADEVLTWTVSVSAAADGYKDSVFTVRPAAENNPLLNITLPELSSGGDGSYDFVEIGGLKWMKKNLNIETAESWCYENKPDSCAKYGRLYTWAAATTACPAGWHLSTRDEWITLAKAAGGTGDYGVSGTASKVLKSTSGWGSSANYNGTDNFGFSALPGGYRYPDGDFNGAGGYGSWWTATENGDGNAYYRNMGYNFSYMNESDHNENYGHSVRCVQ